MLDNKGFDLWADGYDRSVGLSDEDNSYPFAGYKKVLAAIYDAVRAGQGKRVLDIGFGTGVLACRLYADGYDITGIDFSQRMIEIAQERIPSARLIRHDFSEGLPAWLKDEKFDAIICTYAIHHLEDAAKIGFLKELQAHLNPCGSIYIGDVAFSTLQELEECRAQCGDKWDDEEFYVVAEEVAREIPGVHFEKMSHCAGILSLSNSEQFELYIPKLEDLWFYQKMMSDPATMSYNAGWDVDYDGYHRDTGCIDYPDEVLPGWYAAWVGQEPERFYAYIRRSSDGAWIGDVNFYYTLEKDWYDMGIVLYAPYRGKGYSVPALKLLLDHAFCVCGISRLHNDFETTRDAAWAIHRKLGFKEMGMEDGLIHLMLTREDYLNR